MIAGRLKDKSRNLPAGDGGLRPPLTWLLGAAAAVYGGAVRLRADCYRHSPLARPRRLGCPVISIGNLSAGGTGKTPMAILVAGRLCDRGWRVVVLSRGYGGRAERYGGVVSDGRSLLMNPAMAGDEPFLMAVTLPQVPVIVGRNRHAAGMQALEKFAAQVLVLDDGFQHLRLARDLDVVLLDAADPLAGGRLLPRGMLREPPAALSRAHTVVLTRAGRLTLQVLAARTAQVRRWCPRAPIFAARHAAFVRGMAAAGHLPPPAVPLPAAAGLGGRALFAFSGIARNADFRRSVVRLGGRIAGYREFSDHHAYTPNDQAAVIHAAQHAGAEALVTSEKDYVRLARPFRWPLDLLVLGVRMQLLDASCAFNGLLESVVRP